MTESTDVKGFSVGFEHFLERKGAWGESSLDGKLVVLDTNILLKLYEIHEPSLGAILDGLDLIKGQLFLPGQVQAEFWRNRDRVLQRCRETVTDQRLGGAKTATAALVKQARAFRLSESDRKEWERKVREFFQELGSALGENVIQKRSATFLADPSKDYILERLQGMYEARVGAQALPDELAAIRVEFEERCAVGLPPGNRDAHKADGGYGDFLVWRQVVHAASQSSRSVVLVTDDLKDDWWRLFSVGDPINARFELVQELQREASAGLQMLTFGSFMEMLLEMANIEVDESIIDEVDASQIESSVQDEGPAVAEWRVEYLAMMLDQLRNQGAESQAKTLLAAAKSSEGQIPRSEVLKICGKLAGDKLTGFTRVIMSVQQQLATKGLLPAGLPPALRAQYEGPGKAQRFAVPEDLAGCAADVELWDERVPVS